MKQFPTGVSSSAAFPATRWSVVMHARDGQSRDASEALEQLCRAYWMPLYVAVRHFGHGVEDARDLTQEFFSRLIGKHWLDAADHEKGRFRTFLMVALKRFLLNERRRENALIRGGGRELLPLDAELAESLYDASGSHSLSPEQLFDRRWALTLIEQALQRIGREYQEAGRADEFEALKPYLIAGRDQVNYQQLADQLGTTEGAARVAVYRIRKRYRGVFRDEVANTVGSEGDVEEEMRALLHALADSP